MTAYIAAPYDIDDLRGKASLQAGFARNIWPARTLISTAP